MRNLLITIQFDGTAYHGWQLQENALTVQEVMQFTVNRICGGNHTVTGCSRTDAGVHANMYCCTLRTENQIECDKLKTGLNALLPYDISALNVSEAPSDFHPIYSCKSKEYIYKIWNSENKNPFLQNYSLHFKYPLDTELLNKQAKDYIGTHDFAAFCSSGSSVKSTVRTVLNAGVQREGDLVTFSVQADGFLYNMVRIMVGTLLDISQNKIQANTIPQIIDSRDRNNAGITAKPQGLFLNKIYY